MYITKVLSYNGAWEKLLAEHAKTYIELQDILKNFEPHIYDPADWASSESPIDQFKNMSLKFEALLSDNNWNEFIRATSFAMLRNSLGVIKNGVSVKMDSDLDSISKLIFKKLKSPNILRYPSVQLPILINITSETIERALKTMPLVIDGMLCTFELAVKELNEFLPLQYETQFLIIGISDEYREIKVVSIEVPKMAVKIERSIEFKPEHYQAGVGILSYFGTVMRKKYPEQNAKIKIEQEDDKVRLIVESENGDQEIIERAFDEFGLVIHQDIKPEDFYDNYLDVAELKTKLGTFESELKFQHQLVKMKEHRIIELQKDKEFLENIIGKALVRSNSPVYINNHLSNTQNTNINHQKELNQSYDDLDKLIDIADKDSLKKRLERVLTALDAAQNLNEPEEVKNSGGMKQLAKILNEANEVGTEVNDLVEQSGKAFELMKNLGRKYNSVAEWCGLPVIPSVFVKE